MSTKVDLRLRPSMEAPSNARRALDDLSPHLPAEVLDDMRLLVSELVTNSIRHAELSDEEWVGLHIEVAGDTVRVEVVDPGPGFRPSVPTPVVYQESGWGLYLVEQVAHRWGVVDDGLIRVWFEIDGVSSGSK